MDAAVDLTTGIWVEVVATVRVGAVEVGVVGVDWAITLTLHLLLVTTVLLLCKAVRSIRNVYGYFTVCK